MTDPVEPTPIRSGPRNATEAFGRRVYKWQDRSLVSVTSIPKMAGMSAQLHGWHLKNVIEYVVSNASAVSLRVATGDDREIEQLRKDLRKSADGVSTSRIVGVAVHKAAQLGQDPKDVHPGVAPFLRQFYDWREVSGFEPVGQEFQVWNLEQGYAGSVDMLDRARDGSLWVDDLKTGKAVYPEAALQLIAYLMAEFVGADDVVDQAMTDQLQEASGMGILHLSATGWEYLKLRPDAELWDVFRGLLRYVTWLQANKDIATLVEASRKGKAAKAA